MDFMLIQSYLERIPNLEDMLNIPEVDEFVKKFSKVAVEERLAELLDARHLLVTTAKTEDELKKIDFSIPYYIEKLREVLSEEREVGSKRVINTLGTIYSKYVGNKFYSKALLKEFTEHFSHYNTLHYDVKASKGIELRDEIDNFLKSFNKEKDYILLSSITGALYAVLKTLYKDRSLVCSLKESYRFDNGSDMIATIEEADIDYSVVGNINSISKKDYKKVLTDDSFILHSDLFGNKLEGLATLTIAEMAELRSNYDNIFISDKVYLKTNNEEIKKFAYGFEELIDIDNISILDLSKTEDLPQGAMVVGSREEIAKLRESIYSKLFALSKENETLYYLGLKRKLSEDAEESFLANILNRSEGKVKNANMRVLELLQGELEGHAEFGLIEGPYLKVEDGVSYSDAFNRELLVVTPQGVEATEIEKNLRIGEPSILCWLNEGSLLFNLQLVDKREEKLLADKIIEAIKR